MTLVEYNTRSKKKRVSFNLEDNKLCTTYSPTEYDRLPIDSTIYLYSYGRISHSEMRKIYEEINTYKRDEMPVHKASRIHLRLHKLR